MAHNHQTRGALPRPRYQHASGATRKWVALLKQGGQAKTGRQLRLDMQAAKAAAL